MRAQLLEKVGRTTKRRMGIEPILYAALEKSEHVAISRLAIKIFTVSVGVK